MRRSGWNRREYLMGATSAGALSACATAQTPASAKRKPNIIIVLADDLGYGDVGVYGANLIRTPALDEMAREGARMNSFYASANVCTPSRAGLLTGRYPIRTGLAHSVILANDTRGLPLSETTIAEALKPDYATALIGKWHLGHVAPFWPPTVQGFDHFFGLPYSHDIQPLGLFTSEPGVELTEEDVDFHHLTERFFDRGFRFIEDNQDRPFFLLMALTAPHVPLDPHPDHAGRSRAADYGDVVEEVDANVGRMFEQLKRLGLDRDTLVIVTSDNGPWFEGSSGGWRDRKGGAGWEGGYRVPFIARHPGHIPPGVSSDAIAMNIDLMPTLMNWVGASLPATEIDGKDIGPLLRGTAGQSQSPHEELVFFNNEKVAAIRTQRWKLVARTYYRTLDLAIHSAGYDSLIDLETDPEEAYDVSSLYPDVHADMLRRLKRAQETLEPLGVHEETP